MAVFERATLIPASAEEVYDWHLRAGACTNSEFSRTLERVLGRPAFIPVPAAAIHLLLGVMGEAPLLQSARVVPARLQERGFAFHHPTLEEALRHKPGGPQ